MRFTPSAKVLAKEQGRTLSRTFLRVAMLG
jgi:hypothetical protein